MNDGFLNLAITTSSAAATAAIHQFAEELLSHGAGARVIFDATGADGECALAHAYAAALFLTQLTREGQTQAAPHLAAAQRLKGRCNPREAMTLAAIAHWWEGDERSAVAAWREVLILAPEDLVAAKFCQILELSIGDVRGMVHSAQFTNAIAKPSGYAGGLLAFALEQAGEAETALRYARQAVARNPDRDPWAQHAAAHALAALGQPCEARSFLQDHSGSWERCSSFMLTHNWWHLALIELDFGDPDLALAIYDQRVWGVRKGHTQDQINAISLLMRLDLRGVVPAARWSDIAHVIGDRVDDRINGFLDLHYLIALLKSGHSAEAQRLERALHERSETFGLARGIALHARGDYPAAVAAFSEVEGRVHRVGGSNIQRQLFAAIHADSIARSQKHTRFLEPEHEYAAG